MHKFPFEPNMMNTMNNLKPNILLNYLHNKIAQTVSLVEASLLPHSIDYTRSSQLHMKSKRTTSNPIPSEFPDKPTLVQWHSKVVLVQYWYWFCLLETLKSSVPYSWKQSGFGVEHDCSSSALLKFSVMMQNSIWGSCAIHKHHSCLFTSRKGRYLGL